MIGTPARTWFWLARWWFNRKSHFQSKFLLKVVNFRHCLVLSTGFLIFSSIYEWVKGACHWMKRKFSPSRRMKSDWKWEIDVILRGLDPVVITTATNKFVNYCCRSHPDWEIISGKCDVIERIMMNGISKSLSLTLRNRGIQMVDRSPTIKRQTFVKN